MMQDHLEVRFWADHGEAFGQAARAVLARLRRLAAPATPARDILGVVSALMLSGLTLGVAIAPTLIAGA